jgi:predicted PurR-regulated permease PerM
MLVFGVDIPLVEVIFVLCIVIFLLLIEAIVVISLLMKQMHKTNKLGDLIQKLSQTLLEIKSAEIQELDKLRRK